MWLNYTIYFLYLVCQPRSKGKTSQCKRGWKRKRNKALQEVGFKLVTSACSIQENGLYVTKIWIITMAIFQKEDLVTFYKFSIYFLITICSFNKIDWNEMLLFTHTFLRCELLRVLLQSPSNLSAPPLEHFYLDSLDHIDKHV